MTTAQTSLLDEIIVDNFAGGGGASTGMELALGRPVDIAINHDPAAILMHQTNHPHTEHHQASVWDIDPRTVCRGRPVGLAWFSPDCKHFSKAKGGKPVDKNIRGLAWITLRWAGLVRPRVIILENVEEFQTWGPVRRGKPIKSKQGQTFRRFIQQLRDLGYNIQWRELVAADYGVPTIRRRFFLIARCDGRPIVWPEEPEGLLAIIHTAGWAFAELRARLKDYEDSGAPRIDDKELATLEKAVQEFGAPAQVDMAIEEMSELTKALLKHRRYCEGCQAKGEDRLEEAIAEEMADVFIMLYQLIYIFGNAEQIQKVVWGKIERLQKRFQAKDKREETP